jgi:hypothetical protein
LYDPYSVLVHNRCSDFELVYPVHFGHNVIWIRSPGQKVDANAMTEASFGRDVVKDELASALIYKLQRKKYLKFNSQSNTDSAFAEDASTSLQLLVIWRFNANKFSVRALLIKHSNTITWNEDTLKKLYSMYLSLCRDDDIIEDTWLLVDETVLMTTSKWMMGHAFEIAISEGTRKDDTMVPLWVSSNM